MKEEPNSTRVSLDREQMMNEETKVFHAEDAARYFRNKGNEEACRLLAALSRLGVTRYRVTKAGRIKEFFQHGAWTPMPKGEAK